MNNQTEVLQLSNEQIQQAVEARDAAYALNKEGWESPYDDESYGA